MMKKRSALLLTCLLLTLPMAANAAVAAEKVVNTVNKQSVTIKEVGLKVWELSELSLLEVKSSEYLKDVLKKNGFKIISEWIANVPTAFVAESGSGKPVLGIILEYHALPGLGNAAVARSVGISHVIVNDTIALKNGQVLDVNPGQPIRYPVEPKGRFVPVEVNKWLDEHAIKTPGVLRTRAKIISTF